MNLTTLQADARFLASTDSTGFSDTNLNRSLNEWYKRIAGYILEYCGDFDFDEEEATTNLVANRAEYSLPTDLVKIKRCEVTYDGTTWHLAFPFDPNESSEPLNTASVSQNFEKDQPYFEVRGTAGTGYLKLYPVPDTNVTAGLKIWYELLVEDMSSGTDTPIIDKQYHRMISVGAALDWAIKQSRSDLAGQLRTEMEMLKAELRAHYIHRNEAQNLVMKPVFEDYE